MTKIRGVYENPKESGIWWVQWFDAAGKRHRERAGSRAAAIKLKAKRTTEKLEGRKLPELAKRSKPVMFSELMADALEHARNENSTSAASNLCDVISALTQEFGHRTAETITTLELLTWLRQRAKAKNGRMELTTTM